MAITQKQRKAIDLLATGQDIVAAAKAIDVHRTTIYRWMRENPDFKMELYKERSNVHQLKLSRVLDKVDGSFAILWQIITSTDSKDTDKIRAIRELLHTARYVDEAGVEARLSALEALLDETSKPSI